MQSVGTAVSNLLAESFPELAAALRIARNNEKFAVAVRKAWAKDPGVADFLLSHTNAMFFEKDRAPRKGVGKNDVRHDLCVYVDDSLANSELNARRELLVLMLAQEGIHFQNFNIRFATRSMKDRRLFPQIIEELSQRSRSDRGEDLPQREIASGESIAELADKIDDPLLSERFKTAMTVTVGSPSSQPDASNSWIGREEADCQIKDESRLLEIVKRAFCQSFPDYEQAAALLDQVEGASLEEVSFSRVARSSKNRYHCHLYTSHPKELDEIMSAFAETVISRAKKLKLYLDKFSIHESPEPIKGKRAFPRSGHPLPMRAYKILDKATESGIGRAS